MKATSKIKNLSTYLGGSYVIVNIAVHLWPNLKEIEAELLALTNGILVFSKMVVAKYLNNSEEEV